MGMGIVSPADFEKELNNSLPKNNKQRDEAKPIPINEQNPISGEVIDLPTPGRKEGDVNVPNSLRQVIGATAFEDGRNEAIELGRQFGISPSSVSAYSRGATSTSSYDKTPNESIITQSRVRVQKRAMSKLMGALRNITPDKLANTSAKELASIAKDMSAVVKTMEPESDKSGADKAQLPQFVVFAPQFRDERSYEVVYAKE